jgi:Protein of unknown function (DUF3179)
VWGREVNGLVLTFHLAGINNQNFLMRDEQTGSFWQQITGRAISGPLAGTALRLIPSDELTLALWKSERPDGKLLKEVTADASEYASRDWDKKLQKSSFATVLNFPEHGLKSRDIMLGIDAFGEARAYRYEHVMGERLVIDRVGSEPVILLVGPDGQSVRAFRAGDRQGEFFRTSDGGMMDSGTGSRWNFQGCAVDGEAKGACLERVEVIKDFWFDWRNYHPATSVYIGDGKLIGKRPAP